MFSFESFADVWTKEYENSKFKVGDVVLYCGEFFPKAFYKVLAVNLASEEEGFEYVLEGFSYLVWENELEKKGGEK